MLSKLYGILLVGAILVAFSRCSTKETKTGENGRSKKDFSYCGQKLPESRTRVRRVIGGRDASAHAWPWQVLLLNKTSVHCGGAIISPTFILTAAHCVDKWNNVTQGDLNIFVGKHKIDQKDLHEQKVEFSSFWIHPKYQRGSDTDPGDYDIALVKLKNPIKFNEYVRPICLTDANEFKTGHECFLSGWGYTDWKTKKTSNILQQIKIPLVSQQVCNRKKSYGGKIHDRYLCAGLPEGGKDACFFDSGGPLVCTHGHNALWYQVGIVVWGEGCAIKNKYGVYANVTKFMNTIRSRVTDLPRPCITTRNRTQTQINPKDNEDASDEQKEKVFIAIIAALCFLIVILLTTLCIVNFYTRGYICCTATEKTKHKKQPTVYREENGRLNGEVSV